MKLDACFFDPLICLPIQSCTMKAISCKYLLLYGFKGLKGPNMLCNFILA